MASQIINIADPTTITRIEPANLKSLISFDQGGRWIPIKGRLKTNLQSKKSKKSTRVISILLSKLKLKQTQSKSRA